MHRRNTMKLRIDFGNERAEMQLFCELPGVEITNRSRLNFGRISFRVGECLLSGLGNEVSDCFPFFFQVALKVGASAAENVNRFHRFLSKSLRVLFPI